MVSEFYGTNTASLTLFMCGGNFTGRAICFLPLPTLCPSNPIRCSCPISASTPTIAPYPVHVYACDYVHPLVQEVVYMSEYTCMLIAYRVGQNHVWLKLYLLTIICVRQRFWSTLLACKATRFTHHTWTCLQPRIPKTCAGSPSLRSCLSRRCNVCTRWLRVFMNVLT